MPDVQLEEMLCEGTQYKESYCKNMIVQHSTFVSGPTRCLHLMPMVYIPG